MAWRVGNNVWIPTTKKGEEPFEGAKITGVKAGCVTVKKAAGEVQHHQRSQPRPTQCCCQAVKAHPFLLLPSRRARS